ncbi:hypothetical protein [Actinotignum schaalii]|uniref:hypothetical protein n=1 Tax=Actinotignum schaalii TaxID=59505 RepID=UPI0003FB7711|nr:hypothetical protein [Actinotignum schaalii]AIE82283.1 hypothetical protein FB03_02240 [Actinotignum schaalii]WQN44319.1 hypothetical protein U4A90_04750 [Actinotignum schaalii]
MENHQDFSGIPTDLEEHKVARWASLLAKATWVVLALGLVIGLVFWATASGSIGQDLGVLSWCITFAASIALMSIRQFLLSERR